MNKFDVCAYYFPNFHQDKRNIPVHGKGWNEWDLVKRAEPRFKGHLQPKVPLWGYEDEADPLVFEKKIEAASNHGVNCFLWDWYWYEDGLFLEKCLEEGYLKSKNKSKVKFALHWGNHTWKDIHPTLRSSVNNPINLYHGEISEKAFEEMTDYVIEKYFSDPDYWKIDGAPYFSVYESNKMISGVGGLKNALKCLERFRKKTIDAGFPNLHLNAVVWGIPILPGSSSLANLVGNWLDVSEDFKEPNDIIKYLGYDSVTSYVWVHHVEMPTFPTVEYMDMLKKMKEYWYEASKSYSVPYYPNVTMGWDASPRTIQSDVFDDIGYPFTSVYTNNTPENFQIALEEAKKFLEEENLNILNINAWNEWTEGTYLEPDTVNKYKYLEAIKNVFL
ncbi:glycoside hydrolase family 99-like domain-containing protein [Pelagibacteraceae bacterium]|nr:glycoside hydrolase family 99-like domain-containing protein [Pelagibacteraceae bacterium]